MSDSSPRKKTLGVLPPPPKMTSSSGPNAKAPPAHSVSANIPTLESAPTSGNFDGFTAAATQLATEQFQAAVDVLGSRAPPTSYTGTPRAMPPVLTPQASPEKKSTHIRPPPPPPPPPPPTTRIRPPPPPPASAINPTIAPLPPPPIPNIRPAPPPSSTDNFISSRPTKPDSSTSIASHPPAKSLSFDGQPPPFLPKTQFRSKQLHVTASRQENLTVLVVASESANQIAWKNGLRLSDLLAGLYRSSSAASTTVPLAPFRSISRSITLQWDDLNVDFVEEGQMTAVSDEDAAKRLQTVAALQEKDGNLNQELELLEDQIDNLLSEDDKEKQGKDYQSRMEKHDQVVKDAFQLTSPLNIPWLWRYRMAEDECTDNLQHDHFQCPVVVLAVCTTSETSPVIETLRSLHLHLPIQYRNGQYDPQSSRYEVLVLHDAIKGHKSFDETALRNHLVSAFGPASNVLRINSLAPETAVVLAEEEESDLWGGGGKLGSCMTVSDRARVRKYLTQLVATAVLPGMERRIADLNAIVSDRKKGVRNVLKSFWGGRKREDEEPTPATTAQGIQYRHDSVETQVRLLADSLFLMKDYEAAYSMYRLIKDDFKQDKSWIHYASIHEMMALSLYMHDPFGRAKEVFTSVETALLSYGRAHEEAPQWGENPGRTKMAPAPTRLATRLCLVLISTKNICSGRHLEVADLLASASSNETALGAAVLLEQSAAHYFKAELFRKYAFHMLMSGHMFRAGEQDHHAFRCFASALHIYRDGHWEDLHNHLRSALAAQLFSMNRMAIALQIYAKLVGCLSGGRVSMKSQQKFLNNLLEICKDKTKKAIVGADRMAAPPHLIGAERDAVRKERLDRIVQVIRYTRSASRVLELPNMKLPFIKDSTVRVFTSEESSHHGHQQVPGFGETHSGSNEVWDELMVSMMSELKAAAMVTSGEEIIIGKTLAKTEDPSVRRVIALIEKEKANRNLIEKAKRVGKHVEMAPIRALEEPITVEFELRNTLEVTVELRDIQLVAKMTGDSTGQLCTNEDAIKIRPLVASTEKRAWTFQNSEVVFELSDFCRLSSGPTASGKESWRSAEDNDPFFVVTKQTMTMEPGSACTFAASICPLVSGDLEIVGVRSMLMGEVWVYHPFDIKGPLLQNTRSNRANRVRGESFLLKSRVTQGMPSLTVDLVPSEKDHPEDPSGPVLDAQYRRWKLRVSNVGNAPASNLSLKTNLPWIRINNPAMDATDQLKQVSCTIGPTGTLMSVPLTDTELKESNRISPGETCVLDVDIRPNEAGKHDFYMLFRYELSNGGRPEDSTQHRWLKKMFSVPVYPSLNLRASLISSFARSDEFVLSIEVDNLRTDRPDKLELKLDSLSLFSREYCLATLPGMETSNTIVTIGWQEKSSYHFLVRPNGREPRSVFCTSCSFSQSGEPDEQEVLGSSSVASFLCVEQTHESYCNAVRMHQRALARATASQGEDGAHPRSIASIRRSNVGDLASADGSEVADPTSIARLCPPNDKDDIHLICSWSDLSNSLRGFNTIRGLKVSPDTTDITECPIVVTANHPPSIQNDFTVGPAKVPLHVTLRNKLRKTPVSFEFSLVQPEAFGFTGLEKQRAELAGGAQLSIPLEAVLPSAGVYDLQCVSVVVGSEDTAPFKPGHQWIVTASPMLHEV